MWGGWEVWGGWEDRESRNNCSLIFLFRILWKEMLPKGKPEHLKKNLLKNLARVRK
ncbi:hypothetical protein [Okeania sp. KiyG1]|uniref:hypothetical protein n=1 Tax=Okeania sp. KiyG1 TaxID=2720165 RepID=UPI0019236AA0|nr:hypothetical protein [Okeania sp. KiyG1]